MLLHLDDLETDPSKGGRIWLTIGEEGFPEEGWYDLPGIKNDSNVGRGLAPAGICPHTVIPSSGGRFNFFMIA